MSGTVADLGLPGAQRARCPACGASLVTACTHPGTHRTGTRLVLLPCPACHAPETIRVYTAAHGQRIGTAKVYRAVFAPPWVRARLPPADRGWSGPGRLLRPALVVPLIAAAGLLALWIRLEGWVNVRPVLVAVVAAAAIVGGGIRALQTPRLKRWTGVSSARMDAAIGAILLTALLGMVLTVLAVG